MLSASPSSAFSHKVHNIRFEKEKYVFYHNGNPESNWPPVSESSARISKFYDPTDSEYKFYKMRIKSWLSIGLKLGFPWLRTYCHNHYTMLNRLYTVWWGALNFYIPIFKALEQSWRLFIFLNCASALKIQIKSQQKPTICLVICKHSTQTKLRHPAPCW